MRKHEIGGGDGSEKWRQAKHTTAKRRVLSDTIGTSRFISHAILVLVISKDRHS